MADFHKHSSDARSIGFNMQWYRDNRGKEQPADSVAESMTYNLLIFFFFWVGGVSNNTGFVGIGFGISVSCFVIKALISSFFLFMVGVHYVKSVQIRSFLWSIFSCIWTEYGPEKTPYPDTFHTVVFSMNLTKCFTLSITITAFFSLG